MAPCGGSSGFPKEIGAFSGAALAAFIAAAVTTPPTAVAANMSRLDIILHYSYGWGQNPPSWKFEAFAAIRHCGLTKTGIDFAAGVLLFRSW